MKRLIVYIFFLIIAAFFFTQNLAAKKINVGEKYSFKKVSQALASSQNGDTIYIYPGTYYGNLAITKSVTIIGKNYPAIDGQGDGTVITVEAPDVIILGLKIQNSGNLLDKEDAGILVKADGILVQNNILKSVLFGIYFRQANHGIVRDNLIEGKKELDVPRRGDLFRAWYCKDLQVANNTLEYGRDFIIWFSHNVAIQSNNIAGARYGLHFMYSSESKVIKNNVTHCSVGMYLMYSKNLQIEKNLLAYNRGASGFGIGLKDLDNVKLNENVIADNRVGIFIDNSPRNYNAFMKYNGNVIAYNETGIDVLSSLENSHFRKNSLIENYEQVSLTRNQNPDNDYWERNYWSNYTGFDENKDGLGDIPFKENQVLESLLDNKPKLRVFLYSPAINTLNYAADAFPILKPEPLLIDKTPLIKPLMPNGVSSLKIDRDSDFILLAVSLSILSAGFLILFYFKNSLVWKKQINVNFGVKYD